MASDTTIGGVGIIISGDYSKLAADFTAAQRVAQSGASAISSAVGGAFGKTSPIVDQFGRSIQVASAEVVKAVAPANAYAAAGAKLATALISVSGAEEKAAESTRKLGAAHAHAVTDIQATSGALRVLEGTGGIRAAERFLTMIPGLSSALQLAFPVVGAIALFDAMDKLIGKSIDLKGSLEALKKATSEADAEFANLTKTVDRINTERLARDFGRGAALKQQANQETMDAQDALIQAQALRKQAKVLTDNFNATKNLTDAIPYYGSDIRRGNRADTDALEQKAQGLEAQSAAITERVAKDREDSSRDNIEEAGRSSVARIEVEVSTAAKLAELRKQQADVWIASERFAKQAVIDEQQDAHARAVATAAMDVDLAIERSAKIGSIEYAETQRHIQLVQQKAAAESAGKTPNEVGRIRTTAAGEVSGLRSDQEKNELTLHAAVLAASGKLDEARANQQRAISEEIVKEGEKRLSAINNEVDEILAISLRYGAQMARVAEISARGNGASKAAGLEGNKLALERAYGLELGHTLAQQVAYLRQIASLEAQAGAAKVQGLDQESAIALTAGDVVRWAELAARANEAALANKNRQFDTETRILEVIKAQSLAARITADAQRIPGAIGGGLAGGLAGGSKVGANVAKDIENSLKNVGQQLLGNIFTAAIQKLVVQLGINTAAQSILSSITGVHVAATTASAVATTANATVTGVHAGALIGNTIATTANTIATIWNSVVEAAKAFLGFADGGSPPVGIASIVGERGPELFIPHQAGTIIPHGMFNAPNQRASLGNGRPLPSISSSSSSNSSSIGDMHFHISGAQSPREVARSVADYLKSTSPKFSPKSS